MVFFDSPQSIMFLGFTLNHEKRFYWDRIHATRLFLPQHYFVSG
jgi:hypothetical protein